MGKKFSRLESHKQHSLRGWVHDYIRDGILDGRYKPGEALVEMKLSEEMGVSRTPVREAISQLEQEGLVNCIPNRGVFVIGITQEDIDDIYAIRSMIEGLAARWAVERIDQDQLKELEETVELMEYYTGRNDMEQVARLDTRFHNIIYDACGSKVIKHILSVLLRYVQRVRLDSLKVSNRAALALEEHRHILDTFIKGDPQLAERLMKEHIIHAGSNVHSILDTF